MYIASFCINFHTIHYETLPRYTLTKFSLTFNFHDCSSLIDLFILAYIYTYLADFSQLANYSYRNIAMCTN